MKRILIAPDSFKECMPSERVAAVLAAAARERWPGAEVVEMPLADGGEGTLEVLVPRIGARIETALVHDPRSRPIEAKYADKGDTAIIEVAKACGIQLLSREERNPLAATTRGVGELILAAHGRGCRRFIIGLGGTATCDGGLGMLEVPGVKDILREADVELLSDVDAPLTGPGGMLAFAPQKGASERDIEELEKRISLLARQYKEESGKDVALSPGAGAAGGLGAAFMAFSRCRTFRGIDRVMDLAGFDSAASGSDLIITGEGKSDAQTLMGKVPMGVLGRAKDIPVALLSGRVENKKALEAAGFRAVVEVTPRDIPLREALRPETASGLLRRAVLDLE